MIIGLTGGIASGKSTVSNYLEELGAIIVDSDTIAHQIIKKGKPVYYKIIDKFTGIILDENKEINRSRLGSIIFKDWEMKRELEEITHPYIIEEIFHQIEEIKDKDRIIILDAPLLFEVGLDKEVDQTWLIYVNRKTQIQRLINRDKINKQEAVNRISGQLSLEKKREMADLVIDNNGSIVELKNKVLKRWREINEN